MEEKVWQAIRQYGLFAPGDSVIVALSGGADSVALFHFLHTHSEKLGIYLACAHFEHGIRGEDSLQDAEFVRALCGEYGVPLYLKHGNMNKAPRPKRMGTEAWARQLRYAFFDALAEEHDAKIALAHTMSDQAETVLFNAIRGSGVRGLGGMQPVRGRYVRPLLLAQRAEIEQYCTDNALDFAVDATNSDEDYSRNRLRHSVMPQLVQAHPGAVYSLARLAGDMQQLDVYLQQEALKLLCAAAGSAAGGVNAAEVAVQQGLDADVLAAAPAPVLGRALATLAGRSATHVTIAQMTDVLCGRVAAVQLPGGQVASLKKRRFFVGVLAAPPAVPGAESAVFPLAPGEYKFAGGYGILVRIQQDAGAAAKKNEDNPLTFVADYDKIIYCSEFRTRRAGDRYAPPGRHLTKTLKKWMSEQKIPVHQRQLLPVLAHEEKIYWVWDEGFCDEVAPGAFTQKLLVIEQQAGGV